MRDRSRDKIKKAVPEKRDQSVEQINRTIDRENRMFGPNGGAIMDASFDHGDNLQTVKGSALGSKFGSLYDGVAKDEDRVQTAQVEGFGFKGMDSMLDTFGNKKLTDVVKEEIEGKKANERQ